MSATIDWRDGTRGGAWRARSRRLTPADLRSPYATLIIKGLSPTTVCHVTESSELPTGTPNAPTFRHRPHRESHSTKKQKQSIKPPNPQSVARAIEISSKKWPERALAVKNAAVTDCRLGVIFALRLSHLNGARVLTVVRSLVVNPDWNLEVRRGGKTGQIKSIPLDQTTFEQLISHRDTQEIRAARLGIQAHPKTPQFALTHLKRETTARRHGPPIGSAHGDKKPGQIRSTQHPIPRPETPCCYPTDRCWRRYPNCC